MTAPTLSSRPKEAKLFRNNRSQAVRIPVEFELPGDRVLIHREGSKLIIEPVSRPTNIVELLAEWRKESPLAVKLLWSFVQVLTERLRKTTAELSAGRTDAQPSLPGVPPEDDFQP